MEEAQQSSSLNIPVPQLVARNESQGSRGAAFDGDLPPEAIAALSNQLGFPPPVLRGRSQGSSGAGSSTMLLPAAAPGMGLLDPTADSASFFPEEALSFNNVVKIFVTKQSPDYGNPWMTMGIANSTGSGVVIQTAQGLRILTAAHVVGDYTFVQVQRASSVQDPHKYTAKVCDLSHDCDLALLAIPEDDNDFFKGLRPAQIGKIPALRSVVLVAGFPVGGEQIAITEGVVSRIEGQPYSYSYRNLLAMTVDASIDSGNSGGPVFNVSGELIGIAFQSLRFGSLATGMSASNGHVIPPPILHHFLDGIEKAGPKGYQGVPMLGLEVQELTNRNLRKYFNLDKDVNGVLITKVVHNSSCDGVVEVHDVLTHIDGKPVANNETVAYEGCGRVKLPIVFQMTQCGEKVTLNLIRKGEKISLDVVAKPEETLVARSGHDHEPFYFIYCGLVFQRLSMKFIDRVTPGFSHYERLVGNSKLMSKDWRQVVILSKVLSDEVNVGYEMLRFEQIKKINGENVPDLATLVKKIEEMSAPYLCLETCCGEQIILPSPGQEEAIEANKRIMQHYHISVDRRMETTESA